jgi:hypothetical protein
MPSVPQPNDPPARRRRPRWLPYVVAAGAVLGLAVVLHWAVPRESALERFKRQVRDELPVGSTREAVQQWSRRVAGRDAAVEAWDVNGRPEPPQKCLPEVSGMDRADLGSFMELVVPCGTYTVNGQVAENHLWVFLPLDGGGRVKGHYFLTLAELADDEKARRENRQGGP